LAFDRSRVQFSDEELAVAEAADKIVDALKDGFDLSDLGALLNTQAIISYFAATVHDNPETGESEVDRTELALRIHALASMLVRDNVTAD